MFCFETHMQNLFLVSNIMFPMFRVCWTCFVHQDPMLPQCSVQYPYLQTPFKFQPRISVILFLFYKNWIHLCFHFCYIIVTHIWRFNFLPCYEGGRNCDKTYYCSNSTMLGNIRDLGFIDLTFLLKMQQDVLNMECSVLYTKMLILLSLLQ